MLLSLLNDEEKRYFIDLLNRIVLADGEKTKKETVLFETLRGELQIGEGYKFSTRSLDTLINYFAKKDLAVKKLVYMNLASISLIEDFYRVEVHMIMEKIQEKFALSDKDKKELLKIVYAERDIKEKAKRVIHE